MKLTFLFIFIFASGLFATEADSQTARVTISQDNMNVRDLIRTIENKTDYLFIYSKNEVDLTRKVSVHANNKTVAEILQTVFNQTDVVYAMEGNNIMLMKGSVKHTQAVPQQERKVSGSVTDEKGEPIIGASVSVKGTSIGTITDMDGRFSLGAPVGALIQVSYIGYTTQTINAGTQTVLNIRLKEDTKTLEEVVVVGFGTQKKINLSGSVAAVNMNDIASSRPITNISTALAGVAAGVAVTSANNRPGDDNASILIRGKGTLNDASPLVIIDGMEGDINSVNVQDIESISILKDASSAAIYGSRAASGVILITTKRGKAGSLNVEYNGYVSFQSIRPNVLEPVSNYANYMELMNEGYTNSSQSAIFSQNSIDTWRKDNGQNPLSYPNANYLDETFQNGLGTTHTVSMNGGTDKIRFYAAAGYMDNPGIVENAGYKRYSGRINADATFKPWLKMGMNMNGYVGKSDPGNAGSSGNSDLGVFSWVWATTPAMVYRHNGLFGGIQNGEDDISESNNNPLLVLNSAKGDNTTRNTKARVYVTVNPLKELSVTGSYSNELTDNQRKVMPIFNNTWNFRTNTLITEGTGKTFVSQSDYKTERNYMDLVAHYDKKFISDRLDLGVMAGSSQEQYKYEWFSAYRENLTSPNLSVLNAATGNTSVSGNSTEWTMRSFFGRINLGWEDKYLLEFNMRADGSSRFSTDNRWGYFPSGSAAWRLDQEGFMKDYDWLSSLKLRASYGSLGNNAVGNYAAISSYSFANYVLNNSVATGLALTSLANADLTWEKTKVADFGADFGFLNNQLYGTLDYFNKKTEGILINLPAPAVHGGASVPAQNSAQVTNKGIELTLGWRDKINDFSYSITGNYSYITNNVDKFKGDDYSLNNIYMIKEGLPINSMYLLSVDRIVSTDADLAYVQSLIDNAPKDNAGNRVNPFQTFGTPKKGDILYKDMNHDGIINNNDKTNVGNPNPKHMFGLNLNAAYKGIDFSVFLQGVAGVDGYLNESYFTTNVKRGYQISKEITNNRWTASNTDAKYPRLTFNNTLNTQYSTMWMQDKSYLKIRNIQLGYTFPKVITNRLSAQKIRVYGSLENFFTFTGWKGLDPEISSLSYPTMRQAVLGVNLVF